MKNGDKQVIRAWASVAFVVADFLCFTAGLLAGTWMGIVLAAIFVALYMLHIAILRQIVGPVIQDTEVFGMQMSVKDFADQLREHNMDGHVKDLYQSWGTLQKLRAERMMKRAENVQDAVREAYTQEQAKKDMEAHARVRQAFKDEERWQG